MKYAIYGLPCAGKDYIITQLSKITDLEHIRGSEFLNDNSVGKFRELPEKEQELLRKKFISYVNEAGSSTDVIVDGHYCFIKDGGYNVVFTEDDGDCYDVFFYLYTPSSTIRERISASQKNEKYASLTDEQISKWKEYEIQHLQKECFGREKEFIILNGDNDSNLEFMLKIIENGVPSSVYTATNITHNILQECCDKDVCLIDCDKTISNNDTTDLIFANQKDTRKEYFCGDCYTPFQIYVMNKEYGSIQNLDGHINSSIENADISDELVSDLKELKNTLFVGMTCGLSDIWEGISRKYRFPSMIFGNGIQNSSLITADVKGYVAKFLRQNGKKVIGVGDSVSDLQMLLNSDVGYAIAHNKRNKSLQNILLKRDNNTIKQPESNGILFENVSVVRSIHEDIN